MAYFTEPELQEIKLEAEGYWVKVKKELTFGDAKSFIQFSKEGVTNQVVQLETFLKAVIAEWNLDDSDGNVAPIDDAHINQLSQKDVLAIVNAAGSSIAGNKQEDADFLEKSGDSSTPEK